jgi:mannitol/fructose-specific phosphotransferase system IIA component
MPAAMEVLCRVTFPEGVAFSAATAVVATAIAKKNNANLETVRTLDIYPLLLVRTDFNKP